jgi:exo-beta-1,3-glucanase (GH17 family)
MLRVYGSGGPSKTVLDLIRDEMIDMKVMLGVWVQPEEVLAGDDSIAVIVPGAQDANRSEIEAAVELAAEYPEVVMAVCVGNETQIFWSAHRVPAKALIRTVREVRARVDVPVTVADDFNFWNKPDSRDVARELDFIVTHMHPLWNGIRIDDALSWTKETFSEVRSMHPGRTVFLGETGWATNKHNEGEQATLIKGNPGEEEQKVFFDAFSNWVTEEEIPSFFFEAFDEKWKGGEHPDEVEKHWGLYRSDRTPKLAVSNRD